MQPTIETYLPSKSFLKKVLFIVVSLALIFGVAELFKYLGNRKAEQQAEINQTVSPLIVKDISMIDENQDGIVDWKQNLETALGITPSVVSNDTQAEENLNETDVFARDLLTTAATISQSGDISESGASTIAENVVNQIAQTQVGGVEYTLADIKVGNDVSDTAVSAYGRALEKLFNVTYPLDIDNSVTIMSTALQNEDPAELAKLDPIIKRYGLLIEAVKKMSVPAVGANWHLTLLNDLSKVKAHIETMRNALSNPVMAMSTMMQYPTVAADLVDKLTIVTNKVPYINLINAK